MLQRRVENPVSRRVLAGAFTAGDTVRVDHTDGGYTVATVAAAAAA